MNLNNVAATSVKTEITENQIKEVQARALKVLNDQTRMARENMEEAAWNEATKKPVSAREQDFEVLRDLLVDMCSATLPENAPTQKDWDEIRNRVRKAAAEHSLLTREDKKDVKKPLSGPESIGPGSTVLVHPPRSGKSFLPKTLSQPGLMTTTSMLSSTLSGRKASLIIVDDVI